MGLLIALIIVGTSLWVYLDATANKIGKAPGSNNSAGAWAAGTLLVWIVVFPFYLFRRSALISNAKEHPIEVSGRTAKAVVIVAIGCVFLLPMLTATSEPQLPSCESNDVIATLQQIIDPDLQSAGAKFIAVGQPQEQGFNEASQIRACTGLLVTSTAQSAIRYTVQWEDRGAGRFRVEMRAF